MAIQIGGGDMQDNSVNYKLTKFEKVRFLDNFRGCIDRANHI